MLYKVTTTNNVVTNVEAINFYTTDGFILFVAGKTGNNNGYTQNVAAFSAADVKSVTVIGDSSVGIRK